MAKLTRNVTKDHVLEIFGNFGKVVYCDVPMDKQKSWINTSLAYVEYEKLEEADECIKKMDGGKDCSSFIDFALEISAPPQHPSCSHGLMRQLELLT